MDGMRLSEPSLVSEKPEWLDHPSFSALLAKTTIVYAEVQSPCGLALCQPRTLEIARDLKPGFRSLVIFRLALELAWLWTLPDLEDDAALLLSARAAAGFVASIPKHVTAQEHADDLLVAIKCCGSAEPSRADLEVALTHLRMLELLPGSTCKPNDDFASTYKCVSQLWTFAQSAEALLKSGGDDRLLLDQQTGFNRYGCPPFPQSDVIDLASSTASSISDNALAAVEAARQDLLKKARHSGVDDAIEYFSSEIRCRLLAHFGIDDSAECLLTASGTDAALVTTFLLKTLSPDNCLHSILMSPSETGSGMPNAVAGRHFADCAAGGIKVAKADPLSEEFRLSKLETISTRKDDGSRRPAKVIDQDCRASVARGLEKGSVILHALKGSKTDLDAPSQQVCRELATVHGSRIHVMVDACQMRLDPSHVRDLIEAGFIILITGSKFFAAPGFCGAILLPTKKLREIMCATSDFSALWPYATLANGVVQRRCPGLILRWTAALYNMDRLKTVPRAFIEDYLLRTEKQLRQVIGMYDRFELVDGHPTRRTSSQIPQSIFTFRIKAKNGFLSFEELRSLYEQAYNPSRNLQLPSIAQPPEQIRFGQPVKLGDAGVAGLRVAISSRHIFDEVNLEPQLDAAFNVLASLLEPVEHVCSSRRALSRHLA